MSDSIPSIETTSSIEDGAPVQPDTALASSLGSSSPPLTAYRGSQTAKVFSSTREELAALLARTGVYDLGWRSFLRCSGRDRVRWLNGMVTNSVKDLGENVGCYAFVLNAQGRIQGDLNIYHLAQEPEALWLQTDRAQIEPLQAFVRRYIIMDQVILDPLDTWTAIGIAGPGAADKIAALGLPAAELLPIHLTEATWRGNSVTVAAVYSPRVPRYEIWIESKAVLNVWMALIDAGAVPCGASAVEQLRILEGTPAYGVDIADRTLPQETNQMRALHFTKGCYLGQEIVERIRSRGNVHRTLSGFLLEGDPPTEKTSILIDGKTVGELTSVAHISIPAIGERVLALGHIKREALESKQALTAAGNEVTPCTLPFDFTSIAVQP